MARLPKNTSYNLGSELPLYESLLRAFAFKLILDSCVPPFQSAPPFLFRTLTSIQQNPVSFNHCREKVPSDSVKLKSGVTVGFYPWN